MTIWLLSQLSIQPRTSLSKFENDFIHFFNPLLSCTAPSSASYSTQVNASSQITSSRFRPSRTGRGRRRRSGRRAMPKTKKAATGRPTPNAVDEPSGACRVLRAPRCGALRTSAPRLTWPRSWLRRWSASCICRNCEKHTKNRWKTHENPACLANDSVFDWRVALSQR